jgi:hypothetical protein
MLLMLVRIYTLILEKKVNNNADIRKRNVGIIACVAVMLHGREVEYGAIVCPTETEENAVDGKLEVFSGGDFGGNNGILSLFGIDADQLVGLVSHIDDGVEIFGLEFEHGTHSIPILLVDVHTINGFETEFDLGTKRIGGVADGGRLEKETMTCGEILEQVIEFLTDCLRSLAVKCADFL